MYRNFFWNVVIFSAVVLPSLVSSSARGGELADFQRVLDGCQRSCSSECRQIFESGAFKIDAVSDDCRSGGGGTDPNARAQCIQTARYEGLSGDQAAQVCSRANDLTAGCIRTARYQGLAATDVITACTDSRPGVNACIQSAKYKGLSNAQTADLCKSSTEEVSGCIGTAVYEGLSGAQTVQVCAWAVSGTASCIRTSRYNGLNTEQTVTACRN